MAHVSSNNGGLSPKQFDDNPFRKLAGVWRIEPISGLIQD